MAPKGLGGRRWSWAGGRLGSQPGQADEPRRRPCPIATGASVAALSQSRCKQGIWLPIPTESSMPIRANHAVPLATLLLAGHAMAQELQLFTNASQDQLALGSYA